MGGGAAHAPLVGGKSSVLRLGVPAEAALFNIQYRKLVLELGQGGGALHDYNLAAAHIDLRIVSTDKSTY